MKFYSLKPLFLLLTFLQVVNLGSTQNKSINKQKDLVVKINGYSIKNIGIDILRWLGPKEYFYFRPSVRIVTQKQAPAYDEIEFCYEPKSILRRIQIEQATLIAYEIAKIAMQRNEDGSLLYKNIVIKGWSLGSSLAIYLIAILDELTKAPKNGSLDKLIAEITKQVPLLEGTIKNFATLIKKKVLNLTLITIGTPITKELDRICNHPRFFKMINTHYHFFYKNDWLARMDPGFSSESICLPYRKATAFSAKKLTKISRKQIHLNVDNQKFHCSIKATPYFEKITNHNLIAYFAGKSNTLSSSLLEKIDLIYNSEFFEVESLEPLVVKKISPRYFEEKKCFLKKNIFEMKKTTFKKALISLGILIGLDRYFGLTEKITSKSSSFLKI